MDKKTKWGFALTITGLLLFCVAVFAVITVYMTKQNSSTLDKVASIYMEGMSGQIQKHFETLVDMRLVQINALIEGLPPRKRQRNGPNCERPADANGAAAAVFPPVPI